MYVRFGTGFSYVLIFSSLLVKLVFLISLNTGVYLPALYQVGFLARYPGVIPGFSPVFLVSPKTVLAGYPVLIVSTPGRCLSALYIRKTF